MWHELFGVVHNNTGLSATIDTISLIENANNNFSFDVESLSKFLFELAKHKSSVIFFRFNLLFLIIVLQVKNLT